MEIRRYLTLLQRRWWLVLLAAVTAGATAFFVSIYTTPVYRASAQFLIDELPGTSDNEYNQVLLEQRLAQTYVEIIKMPSVLDETIRQLGLPYSPRQLEEMASVSVLRDTQIIDVSVEDTDPDRAANIANTMGQVFIEQNQERENARYAEPIANWEERASEISDDILALEAEIRRENPANTPEEQAALSRMETQLSDLQIRYEDTINNLNALLVEQARQSSNVVPLGAARPNPTPVRPRVLRNAALATLAGAMVGIGIVFLLDYLDDTIKDADQIQEDTGLTTLGTVAEVKDLDAPSSLVTHDRPRDPVSEAYRTLRTNLSYAAVISGQRTVLVTSPMAEDGKSTLIANLALVFAQTGIKVVVVDADLRRADQHEFFSLPNSTGLTSAILNQGASAQSYLQETGIAGLSVLTSGPVPPNPAELLGSPRMTKILEALSEAFDLVLIDSPPALGVTDAAVLAPLVSGCLLVVRIGHTKRAALVQVVNMLEASGAHVYGAVMNMVKTGWGYSGYYYHEQQQDDDESQLAVGKLTTPEMSKEGGD